jgi:hypothetical protein
MGHLVELCLTGTRSDHPRPPPLRGRQGFSEEETGPGAEVWWLLSLSPVGKSHPPTPAQSQDGATPSPQPICHHGLWTRDDRAEWRQSGHR